MTEKDEIETIKNEYQHEIASFKRVASQFDSLRNWLLTTSLASLAFVLTFLLQIRLQSPLPFQLLAEISIGFLIFSVACAIYGRTCHEVSGMAIDIHNMGTLFSVFLGLIKKDKNISKIEKTELVEIMEGQINRINSLKKMDENFNPYSEVWRFLITVITLVLGLCASCVYFWFYLF